MVLSQTFKKCAVGMGMAGAVAVAVPAVLFCTDKIASGAMFVAKQSSQALDHLIYPNR